MQTKPLGTTGPQIASVGLGCMDMSAFYGPTNDQESVAVIHRALDIGVNLLDTADMYGFGENEALVGKALKGRRDDAVLATKFAIVRQDDGSFGI